MATEHDHHDGGFHTDLRQLLTRRRLMTLAGAAGLLAGCDGLPFLGGAEANTTARAADGTSCIKLPAETNGPFPADGSNRISGATVNVLDKTGIIRPDMRGSFDGLTDEAEGVSFDLEVQLVDVGNACTPLSGHLVYFWQCDAAGTYSIYERANSNYLRGAAVTDATGMARMTTIIPGCYAGRWPHIHFEVFAAPDKAATGADSLLVSQFALPKEPCEAVYATYLAYAASQANLTKLSLETDMIFANNTPEQLAAQTLSVTGDPNLGYAAKAVVGILAAKG